MFSPKAEAILLVNYPFQPRKIPPSACTVGYHTIIPWVVILVSGFLFCCFVFGGGVSEELVWARCACIGVIGYINLPRGRSPFLRVSWCFASFAVGG